MISICAPMGSGKTYQVREFLKQFPQGTTVLWITCRVGMAKYISEIFPKFSVYLDINNQNLQIQEFESLHKLSKRYKVVIMNEIRSSLKSATCFETNVKHIVANMEQLETLCTNAERVVCMDADLNLDECANQF